MTKQRINAYLMLLTTAAIWGVAASVIKFTLAGITPFNFLTYRFLISGLIALVLLVFGRIKLPKKKSDLGLIFLVGLTGNTIALGFLFLGLAKTTVLDTSIIEAMAPLLIGFLGVSLMNDRVTRREKIGIAIAMVGTMITIFGPLGENGVGSVGAWDRFMGNVFIFLFVVADACAFILAKKLTQRRVKSDAIANLAFIAAFLTTAPIALGLYGLDGVLDAVVTLSLPYHLGVWYMAVISGSMAYWLWTRGQKTIEVSEAAVFRYMIPVFATPLAILWIGESLSVHFIVGAVVIFTGVGIAEWKASKGKA